MNISLYNEIYEKLQNINDQTILEIPKESRLFFWELMLGVVQKVQNYDLYVQEKCSLEKNYEKLKKNTLSKQNKQNPLDLRSMNFNECKKLKANIEKDIYRTYQEYETFHSKKIHDLLTNVLTVWGILNPCVSYRQGMNEIVGMIVHADSNVTEGTLYYIFDSIMNKLGHKDVFFYSKRQISTKDNPLLKRILNIYNNLLRNHNIELFRFLSLGDFQPEIFMIRWIKCLLTREFNVSQSLLIWDHIFLEFYKNQQPGCELIDYMIIKMIDMKKEQLYEEQSSFEMIRFLLNYPTDLLDMNDFISQSKNIQRAPRNLSLQYQEKISDSQSSPSSVFMEQNQSILNQRKSNKKGRDGCTFNISELADYLNPYTGIVKIIFKFTKQQNQNQYGQKELAEFQQTQQFK